MTLSFNNKNLFTIHFFNYTQIKKHNSNGNFTKMLSESKVYWDICIQSTSFNSILSER